MDEQITQPSADGVDHLINAAIALACAEDTGAAAMAEALPGGARLVADDPLDMGGETFGWRRLFAFEDGGTLHLTRLSPWGSLHRIG